MKSIESIIRPPVHNVTLDVWKMSIFTVPPMLKMLDEQQKMSKYYYCLVLLTFPKYEFPCVRNIGHNNIRSDIPD